MEFHWNFIKLRPWPYWPGPGRKRNPPLLGVSGSFRSYPKWPIDRGPKKVEMSKSKIENAKIENSKNPRLLSEESAEPHAFCANFVSRLQSSVHSVQADRACFCSAKAIWNAGFKSSDSGLLLVGEVLLLLLRVDDQHSQVLSSPNKKEARSVTRRTSHHADTCCHH